MCAQNIDTFYNPDFCEWVAKKNGGIQILFSTTAGYVDET